MSRTLIDPRNLVCLFSILGSLDGIESGEFFVHLESKIEQLEAIRDPELVEQLQTEIAVLTEAASFKAESILKLLADKAKSNWSFLSVCDKLCGLMLEPKYVLALASSL